MKPSDQPQREAHGQRIEAIVAQHVSELFKRLPMLSGFWLQPDLQAEVSVFTWPGCSAGQSFYEEVMRSLVALAAERPETVQFMRGRTFARRLH